MRNYSATEHFVLYVVLSMPETAAMPKEKLALMCAEALPVPKPGTRDNRMIRCTTAISDLCRGKDAPFKEIYGIIHFLTG
jgi:hypothetical protein